MQQDFFDFSTPTLRFSDPAFAQAAPLAGFPQSHPTKQIRISGPAEA